MVVVTEFRDYLLGLGLAPKTVSEYERKLRCIVAWSAEHSTTIDTLTASEVSALSRTFPQTLSTLGQVRATLRHYWEMTERDRSPYRAVRLPKPEPAPPRPLEPEEAAALVKTALGWWPEGTVVLAGLYLGLRRETIASMTWDGFSPDLSTYRFQTKGSRVLTRPVHPMLRDELTLRQSDTGYLFPGSRTRAYVHPATVASWIDRVAEAAGVGHVAPHRLRHTILTEMNDRTRDIRGVAEFAGHVKLSTTRRYTRVTSQRLEELVAALDYLNPV